jgi:hypothetical protein
MSSVAPIAAFAPDLMDRSRIAGVHPSTVFATKAADLASLVTESRASLVFVDLARTGVLDVVATLVGSGGVRVIGFASHVDDTVVAAAVGSQQRQVGSLRSKRCHEASLIERGSKNRQNSGQANGASSA